MPFGNCPENHEFFDLTDSKLVNSILDEDLKDGSVCPVHIGMKLKPEQHPKNAHLFFSNILPQKSPGNYVHFPYIQKSFFCCESFVAQGVMRFNDRLFFTLHEH